MPRLCGGKPRIPKRLCNFNTSLSIVFYRCVFLIWNTFYWFFYYSLDKWHIQNNLNLYTPAYFRVINENTHAQDIHTVNYMVLSFFQCKSKIVDTVGGRGGFSSRVRLSVSKIVCVFSPRRKTASVWHEYSLDNLSKTRDADGNLSCQF